MFAVVSSSNNDHAVLVDTVVIFGTGSPLPTTGTLALGTSSTSTALSFESPSLNPQGVSLQAHMSITLQSVLVNHGVGTSGLGGIALTTGPFDPPAPVGPPDGSQYAFVQTSPDSASGMSAPSNMSTTITGLNVGASYLITFWWGARLGGGGASTQSQLTIYVNGNPVYASIANLVDNQGWSSAQTSSYSASQVDRVLLSPLPSSHSVTVIMRSSWIIFRLDNTWR